MMIDQCTHRFDRSSEFQAVKVNRISSKNRQNGAEDTKDEDWVLRLRLLFEDF